MKDSRALVVEPPDSAHNASGFIAQCRASGFGAQRVRIQRATPPESARNAEPPMKDFRARVVEPPDSARNAPEPGLGG
eukprot:12573744-Alexandrium_andersonii.AAC.1